MSGEKRKGYRDVVKEANISLDQFDFYRSKFAGRSFPYGFKPGDNYGWITKSWNLAPITLARHLNEEYYIGTYGNNQSDYFVIDIDTKRDKKEFRKRVNKIREIFPYGVPIQSSQSQGIHYYQFLDDYYPLSDIHRLVRARLQRHGVEIKAGYIELFPKLNNGLRTPLGKDSFVIDPEDFTRLTTTKYEDMYYLQHQAELVPFEQVFTNEDNIASTSQLNTSGGKDKPKQEASIYNTNIQSSVSIFNSQFGNECLWYWDHGIQEFGTRNEIMKDLVFFFMSICGYSGEQTYEYLEAWLYGRNNGNSNDWNTNPNSVLGQLEAQIRYTEKIPSRRWHGLSASETNRILDLNQDYKSSQFLFDLSKFLKTNMNNNGEVYISRNLWWKMAGSSHHNYQKRIALAISLGFIEKARDYTPPIGNHHGLPTQYRTQLIFDIKDQRYFDFSLATAQICGEENFVRRFGIYYWEKLVSNGYENINVIIGEN
jgi:hypothetical protein